MKKETKQKLKDIIFPNTFALVGLSMTNSRGKLIEIVIKQEKYSTGYSFIKGYMNNNEEEVILDYVRDTELSYIYDRISYLKGDWKIGEVKNYIVGEDGKYFYP